MRIFVGYHYGPNETWVKDYVYRLVRAFGDEVDSGEQLYLGPNLSDAILDKIRNCDGLIGVASRDQLVNGVYTTHRWVQDEMAVARTNRKLFVQMREMGIDPRLGILEGAQYIEYDGASLAGGLVKLAEALGQWHSLRNVPLHLLPAEFAAEVAPRLHMTGFYCRYRILDPQFDVKAQGDARIVSTPGGLRVMLRSVPRDCLIEVEAGYGSQRWISDAVSVDSPSITMRPI